jgi:formamidopyrimidine-DNA glycosylase
LYNAKLSPYRKVGTLNQDEIKNLYNSIKKIIKLCYANNIIGYMEIFGDYINDHIKGLEKGEYPDYLSDVNIGNKIFKFRVYQQKQDSLGNPVEKASIIKGRTTYWVPDIQS